MNNLNPKFSQNSDEYIENGYYVIEGVSYMSIWTFKNKNFLPNNYTKINGEEGKLLIANGVKYYPSIPDFGDFDEIFIYPVDELNKFYKISVEVKPIEPNNKKVRFFIGYACYSTWTKLFVLSYDGVFYSEYLNFMQDTTINKRFDFATFKESDYSYGGYQHLKEISKEEALRVTLTRQANWIARYLRERGLDD